MNQSQRVSNNSAALKSTNKKKTEEFIQILGVAVSITTKSLVLKQVCQALDKPMSDSIIKIVTPNSEQIVMAQHDDVFRHILNSATIAIADGQGVVLASRWLRRKKNVDTSLSERITGIDMMQDIAFEALRRGKSVFLLGGRKGVAKRAANQLITQFNTLFTNEHNSAQSKVHAIAGPGDVSHASAAEWQSVFDAITQCNAAVVFIAFGAPQQELFMNTYSEQLRACGIRVAMVVGGAFDVLAGDVSRAPIRWQQAGFEWLWRLFQQPWRFRRQLQLFKFWWLVVRS